MKNILKLFIGLILFVMFSCHNITNSEQETLETNNHAYISISLNGNARTVLPQSADFEKDFELSFELQGQQEGKDLQTIKKWTATTEKTAYTLMTEDTSVLINTGLWNFELSVQKAGQKVLFGTLEEITIQAGTNTLNFGTLQNLTSGNGSVSVALSFPQEGRVQAVQGGLYNLDGTALEGFEKESLTITTSDKSVVRYNKENVPCGTYLVKFELFSDKEASEPMNVYTEIVQVATGFVSAAQRTLEQLNTLYTITYDLAGGEFVEGFTAQASFNQAMTVTLPTAENLLKTGYVFVGWKNDQGDTVTEIPVGTIGDLTLTAQWEEGYLCTADTVAEIIAGLEASDDPYTIVVTGEISDATISAISSALKSKTNAKVNLDLGNTTGLTTIKFSSELDLTYSWSCLVSIIIPKGVTSIADGAFTSFTGLTSVVIPKGVTYIGRYAFCKCSLTRVVIPEGVTTIRTSAFVQCKSLTSVEIPDSVTTIGDSTFSGCSSLTSVEIPDSVISIGTNAFSGCISLENFDVDENNLNYASILDGKMLCNKDKTVVFSFAPASVFGDVVIPEGVTTIGDSAFSGCSSLESIVIPKNVSKIGSSAFKNCSSLESVEIPDSVTTIGDSMFSGCSSLTSVEIPDSVTTIGSRAFSGCSSLESIVIPKNVSKIGSSAFKNCSSLESVEIPDSVTTIGDSMFSGCSSLTSVEIPDSVTTIGVYAFSGCSSLTSVEIPDSVTTIEFHAFYGCSSLESVEIPDSVTTIGNYAFSYCSSLTSVEIPDSVTTIIGYAFNNCSSLESIVIPKNVSKIGKSAFYGCSKLTSVTFVDTDTWYYTNSSKYTNGTQINVTVPSDNATYLKSTYYAKYWYKE